MKGHQVIAAIYLTKQSEKNKSIEAAQQHPLGWSCHHVRQSPGGEGVSPRNWPYHSLPTWTAPSRDPLDDVFWERVVSSLKLLKPIAVVIASTKGDNAILSDVQTLLAHVREEIRTALPTSLLLQAEETAVLKYIKKLEDFCLKPIHAAAYMLDPKTAGKSILSGAEINKAYGVFATVSRHLGLDEGKALGSLRSTLPSKGFGVEMQYGSRANISNQTPGGRDFVDLRLFPLLPPSSSKSHQHQPPQSATGPSLGTHTPKHATG